MGRPGGTLYLSRNVKPDFIVADDMSEFEVVVETPPMNGPRS